MINTANNLESPASAASVVAPASVWTRGRVVAGAVFLAAGLWAGRGAWEDIFRIATRDEEMSHIWLVPFLCGWLVWMPPRPSTP